RRVRAGATCDRISRLGHGRIERGGTLRAGGGCRRAATTRRFGRASASHEPAPARNRRDPGAGAAERQGSGGAPATRPPRGRAAAGSATSLEAELQLGVEAVVGVVVAE